MCFDGVKRLCHIRGKLRKKVWINQSDIVLIGLRDYQGFEREGSGEGEETNSGKGCDRRLLQFDRSHRETCQE